jgi:hypothetical protein
MMPCRRTGGVDQSVGRNEDFVRVHEVELYGAIMARHPQEAPRRGC